jgi:5'-3' exoribonuclease 2
MWVKWLLKILLVPNTLFTLFLVVLHIVYILVFGHQSQSHLWVQIQVVFTPGQQDKCFLCGQLGHLAAECEGKPKRKKGEFDEKGDEGVEMPKTPYQVSNQILV